VYRSDEVYSGPFADQGPDLIIGYHRGYRVSWASTEGNLEEKVLADNDSAWSADHCIAAEEVPGVLFMNRSIPRQNVSLIDVAPTILEFFGQSAPASMHGTSVLQPGKVAAGQEN
jgi:predicted AlkP superfamily phosphohydrolase/phosphomutase